MLFLLIKSFFLYCSFFPSELRNTPKPLKKEQFINQNKVALQYADNLNLIGVNIKKELIEFIKENCPNI